MQQAIFTWSKSSKLWFVRKSNTDIFNTDCLYAKIVSAIATCNVMFYEGDEGERKGISFLFLRVFIFDHVGIMLNPKALMIDGSV